MKKILLVIVIAFLAVFNLQAQSALPYKPLKSFQPDSTAFVSYNFVNRAQQYKGKPFSAFLKDLEITPIASGMGFSMGEDNEIAFTSIRLYLNKKGKDSMYIQITWQNPRAFTSFEKHVVNKHGMNVWVPRYGRVFGEYIINNITVTNIEKSK